MELAWQDGRPCRGSAFQLLQVYLSLHRYKEEVIMSGDADKAKGRIKEAAGDITGDKDLKREGKGDQLEGKAKEGVDIADKVRNVPDKVRKAVNWPSESCTSAPPADLGGGARAAFILRRLASSP